MTKTVVLFILTAISLSANPITYTIDFTGETSSSLLPTSGSFLFDSSDSTFSNFDVQWDGGVFDFTSLANDPGFPPGGDAGTCLSGLSGSAAFFAFIANTTGCNPLWSAEPAMASFPDSAFDFVGNSGGLDLVTEVQQSFAATGSGNGTFRVVATPEPSTMVLSVLALALIVARRSTKRPAAKTVWHS
jgi:hypothetical protein